MFSSLLKSTSLRLLNSTICIKSGRYGYRHDMFSTIKLMPINELAPLPGKLNIYVFIIQILNK